MAKKYCKKSSVQALANEVKTRKGSSNNIQGRSIASDIENLVIPTQRGAPNTVLTTSSPSTTILRGKYTGGAVSVEPQAKTATLTSSGGYVYGDNNRPLSAVTVPASNVFQVVTGSITPSNGATSLSITGLSFAPKGFIAVLANASGGVGNPYIGGIAYSGNTVYGVAAGSSAANGCPITSASVSVLSGSVTVSNIVATDSSAFSAKFTNKLLEYMVWG